MLLKCFYVFVVLVYVYGGSWWCVREVGLEVITRDKNRLGLLK